MVARVSTVAFEGVEARPVDVQVHIAGGAVAFTVVGLGDKAVAESRERVRSALIASGLALPAKRITVNLAPADMPKEGSHYDLPIALAVMAAIGAVPADALDGFAVIGELALDGTISAVAGVLPAAIAANAAGKGLICPAPCGPEAAWASADLEILAPRSLIQLANHFKGSQVLSRPEPALRSSAGPQPDLRDIKGQESAKRALEVAAAGGHNLLMSGAPGAGKSMLAQRLPSILPPLTPRELLEVSMIHSVAGILAGGALTDRRPFRSPHHSASMPALVGGGAHARPGEISLAHNGVPVPRRTAGVSGAGPRQPAPADRDRRSGDRPRQPPRRLSGAVPVDRGDEPLPLRFGQRAGLRLPRARPTSAAWPNISAACPARSSIASISSSTCPRFRPPIS
jgi:magnesium chelatase family protein